MEYSGVRVWGLGPSAFVLFSAVLASKSQVKP